jgi:RNA polymerase sigma-70 factor (ECF subfamily)
VDPQTRFEELYRAYADRVHAYALRRTTPATADDVVAEVFLVAWRRLDRVPDEPFAWLLGVARRVLANRRRSESRAAALHRRLVGHQRVEDTAFIAVDGRVHEALARLGDRDRELLLLVAWEGLKPAELAEVLGRAAPRGGRQRSGVAPSTRRKSSHWVVIMSSVKRLPANSAVGPY